MASVRETMGSLPAHLRKRMAEIGPVWGQDIQKHREIVVAAYAPLLARSPKVGIAVARDLAYGDHPRQRLDVFRPEAARGADVVIFVHGGAFVRGDKSINGEIYDNVLYWFARQGMLGVNIEYRLAPEARFPAGAEDVALAVRWAVANAKRFGGDPRRIFVIGHSAGGTHVATWAFDPHVSAKPGPGVKGLILISGRLRAEALPGNPNAAGVRAYFGKEASLHDLRSPVNYADRCALPVMIATAEFENPYLDLYAAELFHRLSAARGRSPRFVQMPRHNHISIVAHFNTGEDILGRETMDFMRTA